jgi:signal transduction histidine kinase
VTALRQAGTRRWGDPAWRATALAGVALCAALALALAADSGSARAVALALAAGALPLVVAVLGPGAVRALRGTGGRALVLAIPAGLVLLLLLRLLLLGGHGGFALLGSTLLLALCGLVLVGSDLRQRARGAAARAERSPWQQLTTTDRMRTLPWRAVAGGLLVTWAALLTLGVVGGRVGGAGVASLALVVVVAVAALALVGLPVLVGAAARDDGDRLAQAREDERLRVAAHLHDSVLQTLSLVQRQANDPVAVARLARHQERALRAWMAGHPVQRSDTLAGALHRVVEEVEGEESVEVEVTVLGDRALDAAGDALVAAAREALRNAARHARGAAIVVFAELDERRAAVWVRDEGPGFDLAAVAPERRGVRDAIVGRMAGVGGVATIDSVAGEGTEVALRLAAGDGAAR